MTDFKTTLARLVPAANSGAEGAPMDLRDLLEDNAAAILAIVEAAEALMPSWNDAKKNGYSGGDMQKLQDALALLTGESHD